MLTIKLSRVGKKKQPNYRLIICEKSRDPYGRTLEILGSYNPFSKELTAKNERINYWLSKGAQMTPTINNLLVEKKVIEGKKITASKNPKKAEELKKAAAAKHVKPAPKKAEAEEKKEENT
jgi:small subunit ribosomal protein S16